MILGYLGWMAFSATELIFKIDSYATRPPRTYYATKAIALAVMTAFYTLFAVQKEPWTYYLYIIFPCYFWSEVLLKVSPTLSSRKRAPRTRKSKFRINPFDSPPIRRFYGTLFLTFLALMGMVVSILSSFSA